MSRAVDVLLAHGWFLAEDPHERAVMKPHPPLGLLYLSAYLKERGFDVGVFDATFRTRGEFTTALDRARPRVVGLSVTLMTRPAALWMAAAAKARGATVVVGGPEPANWVEEYLARGADVVVLGEGERTLEELLRCVDRRAVAGIAFRAADGTVARTAPRALIEPLDSLPFPDRGAIDVGAYLGAWRRRHGFGAVSLITARGCPYTCNWCSHSVYGFTHRRRSPANVAEEVGRIVAEHRPEQLWYADDVFGISRRWLIDYAAELERRRLRVPFETISREDRIDEEAAATLAAMGCRRLWLGTESGSQRVLDAMDRRTDAARAREVTRLLQRHGIEVGMFLMVGYDGEETADLEATVAHLRDAAPDAVLTTLAYPIKGTPWHDRVGARAIALRPWAEGSDRDVTVRGRHSRRFYGFARRWLLHEVAADRARRARRWGAFARAAVRARANRLAMRLTEREVERG